MPEERMVAMMPPKAPGLDRGAKGRKASRRRPLLRSPLVAEAAASPSLAARWTPRPACPPRRAPPRGRARARCACARVRSFVWMGSHSCLDGAVGVREERAWHGCSAGRRALSQIEVFLPESRSASRWCTRQSVSRNRVTQAGHSGSQLLLRIGLALLVTQGDMSVVLGLPHRQHLSAATHHRRETASAAMKLRSRLHHPST